MDSVDAIYDTLTAILRDVFDDDALVATPSLLPDQVDGWDSFAQLRVILAVEESFGVRFTAAEASHLENFGVLHDLVAAKRPG